MALSNESLIRIRESIKESGDYLRDKLPSSPGRPVRNSHAHLWERLRYHLGGMSYKDCDDTDVEGMLDIIKWYRDNPDQ